MLLETAQRAEILSRQLREISNKLEVALEQRFELDREIAELRQALRETEAAINAL